MGITTVSYITRQKTFSEEHLGVGIARTVKTDNALAIMEIYDEECDTSGESD